MGEIPKEHAVRGEKKMNAYGKVSVEEKEKV